MGADVPSLAQRCRGIAHRAHVRGSGLAESPYISFAAMHLYAKEEGRTWDTGTTIRAYGLGGY